MSHRRAQAFASASKQPQRDLHVADRALEGLGIADSPFLTVAEAARFCRFDDCDNPEIAFRQWARRNAIPARRRGRRVLLFDRRALEAVLVRA